MTRLEKLLAPGTVMTEQEADALLAEPSPYVVDLYGLRERRPGEPAQQQMSSEARFAQFEREVVEPTKASRRRATRRAA